MKREATSPDEVKSLIEVVERCLKDASIEAISDDLRFIAAYNALLASSRIALRAAGYRCPNQSGHHILTFETLQYTIAADGGTIRKLKAFATQRGTATYDEAGSISATQLRGAIRSAVDLHEQVMAWLREQHGEVLPK